MYKLIPSRREPPASPLREQNGRVRVHGRLLPPRPPPAPSLPAAPPADHTPAGPTCPLREGLVAPIFFISPARPTPEPRISPATGELTAALLSDRHRAPGRRRAGHGIAAAPPPPEGGTSEGAGQQPCPPVWGCCTGCPPPGRAGGRAAVPAGSAGRAWGRWTRSRTPRGWGGGVVVESGTAPF